jgi:hypothetical protein
VLGHNYVPIIVPTPGAPGVPLPIPPLSLPELFAIGGDNQVYERDSGGGGYFLTAPGQVKKIDIGYNTAGRMELFALGGDNQVYEQDFGANGRSAGNYFLTAPGQAKDFVLGHDNTGTKLLKLFAIRGDNQVYEQDFAANGHSAGGYSLTAPGQVKKVDVGYDNAGNMHLFAIGGDNQVYELDFAANGHSAGGYYLTKPGMVKDLGVAHELNVFLPSYTFPAGSETSTGHSRFGGSLELFVVGGDDQVYQLDFDANGHAGISGWSLTAPGRVKSVGFQPYTAGFSGFPDFPAFQTLI